MRRIAALLLAALAALVLAVPASADDGLPARLRVRSLHAVRGVAADGTWMAFETSYQRCGVRVYRWVPGLWPEFMAIDPARCAAGESAGAGLTIAGGKVRWLARRSADVGMTREHAPSPDGTARSVSPALTTSPPFGFGDAFSGIAGSGSTLVLGVQHLTAADPTGCANFLGGSGPGTSADCLGAPSRSELANGLAGGGDAALPLLESAWEGPFRPRSVDAGRVLLIGTDGSARLRLTDGSVQVIEPPASGALDGAVSGRLVAIRRASAIDILQADGTLLRTCPVAAHAALQTGLAGAMVVYHGPHRVRVLRATDCATRVLATAPGAIVGSLITRSGVGYAWNAPQGGGFIVHWSTGAVGALFG